MVQKYRAYLLKDKRYYDVAGLIFDIEAGTVYKVNLFMGVVGTKLEFQSFDIIDVVLEQDVNLPDMNGLALYVGDILKEDTTRGYLYIIRTCPGGFELTLSTDYFFSDGLSGMQMQGFVQDVLYKVGNIHSNPELLELK